MQLYLDRGMLYRPGWNNTASKMLSHIPHPKGIGDSASTASFSLNSLDDAIVAAQVGACLAAVTPQCFF